MPLAPDLLAEKAQCEYPGDAPGERQPGEPPERHSGDPCREGDEGADDRQHAREENGCVPMPREPVVGPVQVTAVHVEDPVPLEEFEATVVADRVGDP